MELFFHCEEIVMSLTCSALFSGVDNVLQKTQEDLGRIKATSFYQRVAPKRSSDPADPAASGASAASAAAAATAAAAADHPPSAGEKVKWVDLAEGRAIDEPPSPVVEAAADVAQVTRKKNRFNNFFVSPRNFRVVSVKRPPP